MELLFERKINSFWSKLKKLEVTAHIFDENTYEGKGFCQCASHVIINETRDPPKKILSFLIISIFIDQIINYYFCDYKLLFNERFKIPKLYSHIASAEVDPLCSPSFLINTYYDLIDWNELDRLTILILRDIKKWHSTLHSPFEIKSLKYSINKELSQENFDGEFEKIIRKNFENVFPDKYLSNKNDQ